MAKTVRAFCIGHVKPAFTPTLPFTMLCPQPLGLTGEVVLADGRFGRIIRGAELAEYSQLFGLQDLLEAGDVVAERLYLFQYRKFIGFRPGGQAATAPWLRIAAPQEAPGLMPTLEELQAAPHEVVVGPLFALGSSVAQNYAQVHVIEDLVAFAACLHAASMNASAVRQFASFQGLLPSPALCLVDTPVFLRHMRVLRSAWFEYAQHAPAQRQGYQMRVAGYLLERLHSHLLCQGLMDGAQASVGLGHRFAVIDPQQPAKAPSPAVQAQAEPA